TREAVGMAGTMSGTSAGLATAGQPAGGAGVSKTIHGASSRRSGRRRTPGPVHFLSQRMPFEWQSSFSVTTRGQKPRLIAPAKLPDGACARLTNARLPPVPAPTRIGVWYDARLFFAWPFWLSSRSSAPGYRHSALLFATVST